MISNRQTVRIRWGDCDPAGIIFYPRYFEIFDNATAALFERALGITKLQMFKAYEFAGWPLVQTHARFLKPTRFGDDVTVKSSVTVRPLELRGRASLKSCRRFVLRMSGNAGLDRARPADPDRIKSHPIPQAVLAKFDI